MPLDLKMNLDTMISTLDGACGRLLVASMTSPVVKEAMEMITKVSLSLGEIDEITWYEYGTEGDEEE